MLNDILVQLPIFASLRFSFVVFVTNSFLFFVHYERFQFRTNDGYISDTRFKKLPILKINKCK